MHKCFLTLATGAALITACNSDKLNVPSFNAPTPGAVSSDPNAIPLAANGILNGDRANRSPFIHDVSIFGREAYDYFVTDGRATSNYLAANPLDPAGFASGNWAGRFSVLRNILNFEATVTGSGLSATSKAAALGFSETFGALQRYYLIETRYNLGIPVATQVDPKVVAPFVSRDSAFAYISGELDSAKTNLLAAGGGAFPFDLPSGFSGFDTPATFLKFNRALAARVFMERATQGGCASCFASASQALGESFLSTDGSQAGLNVGVYHTYSTASGETQNTLAPANQPYLVAHVSFVVDSFAKRADGTPDLRYAKIKVLATPQKAQSPGLGLTTPVQQAVYPSATSKIPIIRNEELILDRAEVRLGTGDLAGALSDINYIRTVSGGLAPSTLTVASSKDAFLTEILTQRKFSLFMEGDRWVATRRNGRLTDLPLDLPTHFRQSQEPVPQAECLTRVGSNAPAPGC